MPVIKEKEKTERQKDEIRKLIRLPALLLTKRNATIINNCYVMQHSVEENMADRSGLFILLPASDIYQLLILIYFTFDCINYLLAKVIIIQISSSLS